MNSTFQLNNRSHLTNNQVELLRDISMGFSNIQMSKARGVTVNAIENAISRLAKKLQVTQSEGTNQRVSLAAMYHRQLRAPQLDRLDREIRSLTSSQSSRV